eukprot:2205928-Rhodomonas_salina.1
MGHGNRIAFLTNSQATLLSRFPRDRMQPISTSECVAGEGWYSGESSAPRLDLGEKSSWNPMSICSSALNQSTVRSE